MSPAEVQPIPRFLGAVRARLWARASLGLVAGALWPGGLMLLGLGLVHVTVTGLPAGTCLAAAALPVALAGLWATAFRRPSLAAAARAADRWFEAKSLLTCAWDVIQHRGAHSPPAAAQVLRQALAAVPGWRQQLPARQPLRLPRSAIVPVVLGLAGGFLLTSVGADASADLVAAAPAPEASALALPPRPAGSRAPGGARPETAPPGVGQPGAGRPATPGAEASDARAGTPPTPAGPAARPAAPAEHARAAPASAEAAAPAGPPDADPGAPAAKAAPGPAAGQAGVGEQPGDETPRSRQAADEAPPPAAPAERVELARAPGGAGYGSLAPGPGAAAPATTGGGGPGAPAAVPVPPATPPAPLTAGAPGRLALRGYVADYFQRLQDDPR